MSSHLKDTDDNFGFGSLATIFLSQISNWFEFSTEMSGNFVEMLLEEIGEKLK